ncbi:hypothetical protein HDV62DRAFT_57964 [Trichoderma sp. SZMC 28011]
MEAVGNPASLVHIIHQCFIYIQQARAFEDEFDFYQLQLKVHLSRCATVSESIFDTNGADDILAIHGIDDLRRASENQEATLVEILFDIQNRLRKAQHEAAKMEADLLKSCPARDADGLKTTRARIAEYLNERKVQAAKTIEGIKWAFYKKSKHNKFIADISALIDHLERSQRQQRKSFAR